MKLGVKLYDKANHEVLSLDTAPEEVAQATMLTYKGVYYAYRNLSRPVDVVGQDAAQVYGRFDQCNPPFILDKQPTISIQVEPTMEFLRDIAVTAVEGGISYWALISRYRWRESMAEARKRCGEKMPAVDVEANRRSLPFPQIFLQEDSEGAVDDPTKIVQLTAQHLLTGLSMVFTSIPVETNAFRSTMAALKDMDAGQIDAETADVIVQLGVLGEVRYG